MINTPNLEQAKKLIKTEKKPIIVKAQDSEFNRKILEYGNFNILLSVESSEKSDSLRQLESGLNHILAKIAANKNIAIGINLDEILKLDKKEKAARLSRIKQNIKICRKAKTKLKILNFKDKYNSLYFLLSLGASTQQAKEAIAF
ncbi:MAG: hypothetical protein AABX83_01790 [Nanoarchaeota archaeon]